MVRSSSRERWRPRRRALRIEPRLSSASVLLNASALQLHQAAHRPHSDHCSIQTDASVTADNILSLCASKVLEDWCF